MCSDGAHHLGREVPTLALLDLGARELGSEEATNLDGFHLQLGCQVDGCHGTTVPSTA